MKKPGNQKKLRSRNGANLCSGLTLLEILIALVVFSFASLYISRTVTRILKQKKKTERELKDRRVSANIPEMIKRDLKGALFYTDMNGYFNRHTQDKLLEWKNERRSARDDIPLRNTLSSQFDFFGKENMLTFTSLVPFAGGGEPRLVKVSYFSQSCANRETGTNSVCLVRGVSRHWKNHEDTEHQRSRILLRGLNSVRFSYHHGEKKEPVKNWKFLHIRMKGAERTATKTVLLPLALEMEIEWEGGKRRLYRFPVSHPFLRVFRPGALSPLVYLNFTDKKSPQEAGRRPFRPRFSPGDRPAGAGPLPPGHSPPEPAPAQNGASPLRPAPGPPVHRPVPFGP